MADYNDDLSFPDPFYISDIETYELLYPVSYTHLTLPTIA